MVTDLAFNKSNGWDIFPEVGNLNKPNQSSKVQMPGELPNGKGEGWREMLKFLID